MRNDDYKIVELHIFYVLSLSLSLSYRLFLQHLFTQITIVSVNSSKLLLSQRSGGLRSYIATLAAVLSLFKSN